MTSELPTSCWESPQGTEHGCSDCGGVTPHSAWLCRPWGLCTGMNIVKVHRAARKNQPNEGGRALATSWERTVAGRICPTGQSAFHSRVLQMGPWEPASAATLPVSPCISETLGPGSDSYCRRLTGSIKPLIGMNILTRPNLSSLLASPPQVAYVHCLGLTRSCPFPYRSKRITKFCWFFVQTCASQPSPLSR